MTKELLKDVDAAIAKIEQEMPIIEEGVENVCLKEEKLKLTALKFMRLMMEPSDAMRLGAILKYEHMFGSNIIPDDGECNQDIGTVVSREMCVIALKEIEKEA